MAKHWADFQYEIYLNGMKGAVPRLPTDLTLLEELTERRLGPGPVGYVAGGAGDGSTMRANREALARRSIVPRMLRDVSERDLSAEVLGRSLAAPVALGPRAGPGATGQGARAGPPGPPPAEAREGRAAGRPLARVSRSGPRPRPGPERSA